jgi:hypothetical protein
MNMQNKIIIFVVLTVGISYAFSLRNAKSDPPKEKLVSSQQPEQESVGIRLARAHVKLSKLDVERALNANQRIANLYSSEFIKLLQLHVVIDEAELEQRLKQEEADEHKVYLKSAETELEIAKSILKAAQLLHDKDPSLDNEYFLESAIVNAEIAELELEQAKQVEGNDSRAILFHFQRQINQLRHQVLQLRMKN